MAQPHYLSKYTLHDYISEIVKKEASPPPPSSRDYIRAARKESKMKATSPLSAEARPFQSKKSPTYISVTSLVSPNQIFQVPVYSSYLPLSTLRQYFPLATNLHYISDQQMITLGMSNNFTMIVDGVELSNQKFCIPFLGTEVTYFVTEDRDLVRSEQSQSVMDDLVHFVRNIHVKMSDSLAEVERMEGIIVQLQSQVVKEVVDSSSISATTEVKNEAFVGGLENVYVVENLAMQGHESLQFMEECLVLNEDSQVASEVADVGFCELEKASNEESTEAVYEVKTSVNSLFDKNQNYVDDYGFSDIEEDDSDDVYTSVNLVLSELEDKPSDVFTKPAPPPVSPQQVETSSLSSRPRCVKRILGNC